MIKLLASVARALLADVAPYPEPAVGEKSYLSLPFIIGVVAALVSCALIWRSLRNRRIRK